VFKVCSISGAGSEQHLKEGKIGSITDGKRGRGESEIGGQNRRRGGASQNREGNTRRKDK